MPAAGPSRELIFFDWFRHRSLRSVSDFFPLRREVEFFEFCRWALVAVCTTCFSLYNLKADQASEFGIHHHLGDDVVLSAAVAAFTLNPLQMGLGACGVACQARRVLAILSR